MLAYKKERKLLYNQCLIWLRLFTIKLLLNNFMINQEKDKEHKVMQGIFTLTSLNQLIV